MTIRKTAYNAGGAAPDMHGFVLDATGAQQSVLLYNVATWELALMPTGTTTPVYVNGTLYELGPTVLDHPDVEGVYFYYIDSTGAMQVSAGFPVLEPWLSFSVVACVVYSKTPADAGLVLDERHTAPRDVAFHRWAHNALGTQLTSDCLIDGTSYVLNSDVDLNIAPAWNGGSIADEDLRTTITPQPTGSYLVFRRTATFWRWDYEVFPFPHAGAPAYPAYDNGGVLAALSGAGQGEWMNVWVFLVPAVNGTEQWIFIPGHSKFTTLASATAQSVTSLSAANLPFVEMVPHYQLTYHARSSHGGTYKAKLESVQRLTGSKSSVTGSGSQTAASTPYTPTTSVDWVAPAPANVAAALDDLAALLKPVPREVHLANDLRTVEGTAVFGGGKTVTGLTFNATGFTKTVTFKAVGYVSGPGLTAHFRVYDVTAGGYLGAELTLPAGTVAPTEVSGVVALANTANILQVAYWVTGGADPDSVVLCSAHLAVTYS